MKIVEQHREASQMLKRATGDKSYAEIAAEGAPTTVEKAAVNNTVTPKKPADAWLTIAGKNRGPKIPHHDVEDCVQEEEEVDDWAAPMDATMFSGESVAINDQGPGLELIAVPNSQEEQLPQLKI